MSCDYRLEDSAKADLRNLGPSVAAEIRTFLDGRIRGPAYDIEEAERENGLKIRERIRPGELAAS